MLMLLIWVSIKLHLQWKSSPPVGQIKVLFFHHTVQECAHIHPPICRAISYGPVPTCFMAGRCKFTSLWVQRMWTRTETLLSATPRQPDWVNWLESQQVGILLKRAKTICGGEEGRKQHSLYLMSLEQTANRTRGGRTENLSAICF